MNGILALVALRGPAGARALVGALAVVCAVFLAALAAGAWSSGVRWFVVETPSMATTAPVGSLVVTAPVRGSVAVGEVVAFRPPGLEQTYTHRVVAVDAGGAIRTRGDLNGAADPWLVPRDRIEGAAIAILPTAGYWLRALPVVLLGAAAVLLTTAPIGRGDLRTTLRFAGMHVVLAGVLLWLKPFAAVVVVTTRAVRHGVEVAVVGTGVLPAKLVAVGTQRELVHVEVGRISTFLAAASESGRNAAIVTIDPSVSQVLLLLLVACLPSAVLLLVGVPSRAESR